MLLGSMVCAVESHTAGGFGPSCKWGTLGYFPPVEVTTTTKKKILGKIPAMSVHESKGVSCCTQLSLQTLAVELSCQAQLFLRF